MTLRIAQESHLRGKDWWDWSVWIDGTTREMADVDHVTYTLHPTFPDPVRRVTTRRNKFRLDSSGWGEFEIFAEIARKNGSTLKRKHWLQLESPIGAPAKSKGAAAEEHRLVAYLSSGSADAAVARRLANALTAEGVQVLSAEDAVAGVPLDKAVDQLMSKADVAVFLLSTRPSLWMYSEIEHALARSVRHIVPVVIGTGIELPPRLESMQAIQVGSAQEVPSVVGQILEAALGKSNVG